MSGVAVGVGASRGVPADEVVELVARVLRDAGLAPGALTALATVDAKATEPGLIAAAGRLGVPLRTYAAETLASVAAPNPSGYPDTAVGTPSVAEAAALLEAGGPGTAQLLVPKAKSTGTNGSPAMATAAVAVPDPPALLLVDDADGEAGGGKADGGKADGRKAEDGQGDDGARAGLRAFAAELARRYPEIPVGTTPAEAAGSGVTRLVAVPLSLVPGGGWGTKGRAREDAPSLAHLSYVHGRALGPDPALLGVLERRLDEALGGAARRPQDREDTWVLLVGRGSADAEANSEVHKAARLLWEGRGYGGVETAFASRTAPDVPAGLERCRRLGARRIVVQPYVLFAGAVPDRIRRQAEGWGQAHPDIPVLAADVVGPAAELARLVVERYREAVAGDGWAWEHGQGQDRGEGHRQGHRQGPEDGSERRR